MPTARFKLNLDHEMELSRRLTITKGSWGPSALVKVLPFLLIICGALMIWHPNSGTGENDTPKGTMLIAGAVLLLLAKPAWRWFVRRSLSKSPVKDEEISYEFSESGVRVVSPKSDTMLGWDFCTAVVHFNDGVLLWLASAGAVWVNKSYFREPGGFEDLRALLASKVKKHTTAPGKANRITAGPKIQGNDKADH